MALDPRYILAPSLEEYFVDKTTGLPLSGGKVYFYSDINRSTLKNVYKLSGSPPNYSYTALPNPSTLSAVGTFQDEGNNNILPYYDTFDADLNVENYYIEVYNSLGVLQFTREAFPNVTPDSGESQISNAVNYIPNGQLLLHNDVPADVINKYPAGQITSTRTELAQGGFSYRRSGGSTAIDNVTFVRYPEYVEEPSSSPRYACRLVCSTPSPSDLDKGFYWEFGDVNKFSTAGGQTYTFSFFGETYNSGDFTAQLKLVKYFGTGGTPSPTEVTILTSFLIQSLSNQFQFSFSFGNNDGFNIGTNNDDYVALELSFPTNISLGISVTDFMLLAGTVKVSSFVETTDKDFSARSLVLNTPAYDGSDLGLPVVITKTGLGVDRNEVGRVYHSFRNTEAYSFLCDGSQYLTSGYQANGIPNRRLFNAIYDEFFQVPKFGTGATFLTSRNQNNGLVFANNTGGAVTASADGAIPTTFVFNRSHIGSAGYGVTSYGVYLANAITDEFVIQNVDLGAVTHFTPGTSGFVLVGFIREGNPEKAEITRVKAVAAAGLANLYFTFNTVTTGYYVWFKYNGTGTDPAVGGRTGILVNLVTGDTAEYVAEKVSEALSGAEVTDIKVAAASAIPAGAYFTFNTFGAVNNAYYVWYRKDGTGTDPNLSGKIGIVVDLITGDGVNNVQLKTHIAINTFYFAVPDFRNVSLKGLDPTGLLDRDFRYSTVPGAGGYQTGSFQYDSILSHNHAVSGQIVAGTGVAAGASSMGLGNFVTGYEGGKENTVFNCAVNMFIKY